MPTQDFPGSSDIWFPVAPGITSIGAVSLTKTPVYMTNVDGDQVLDGNGDPIVLYYNLTVDKLVPVWNQSTKLEGRLVIGASVESLPYALSIEAGITATLKVKTAIQSLRELLAPAAAVTVTAGVPTISTGARIAIPAASVTATAAAPTIGTMVVVSVPVATVSTTAVAPAGVGQLATFVNVPTAAVTAVALLPVVSKSAAVAVPAVDITVTAMAPDEAGPPKVDYWSTWSQQVYGYDRDWSVDWWAD